MNRKKERGIKIMKVTVDTQWVTVVFDDLDDGVDTPIEYAIERSEFDAAYFPVNIEYLAYDDDQDLYHIIHRGDPTVHIVTDLENDPYMGIIRAIRNHLKYDAKADELLRKDPAAVRDNWQKFEAERQKIAEKYGVTSSPRFRPITGPILPDPEDIIPPGTWLEDVVFSPLSKGKKAQLPG